MYIMCNFAGTQSYLLRPSQTNGHCITLAYSGGFFFALQRTRCVVTALFVHDPQALLDWHACLACLHCSNALIQYTAGRCVLPFQGRQQPTRHSRRRHAVIQLKCATNTRKTPRWLLLCAWRHSARYLIEVCHLSATLALFVRHCDIIILLHFLRFNKLLGIDIAKCKWRTIVSTDSVLQIQEMSDVSGLFLQRLTYGRQLKYALNCILKNDVFPCEMIINFKVYFHGDTVSCCRFNLNVIFNF